MHAHIHAQQEEKKKQTKNLIEWEWMSVKFLWIARKNKNNGIKES